MFHVGKLNFWNQYHHSRAEKGEICIDSKLNAQITTIFYFSA